VPLREYAVFIGALAATLTELYEPYGVNDNLTVPVIAGLLLTWGFLRIEGCVDSPPDGMPHAQDGPLAWTAPPAEAD